jgi:predicted ferric reductase
MGVEMEPDLKWMAYYSWHIATIIIAVVALGYTAAAIWSARLDYAIVSTGIAFSLVALAIGVAVKAKLPLRTFPIIPLFGLVVVLGLAGIWV